MEVKVATRRTTSLLAYTNHIHVVSPTITDTLQKYLEAKQITYEKKLFEPQDVKNADMVIAATNQSDVNNDVGQLCLRTYYLIMQDKQT